MIKNRQGIEAEEYFKMIKNVYLCPAAGIFFNQETLEGIFTKIRKKTSMPTILVLFNIVLTLELPAIAIRQID